MSLSLGSGTRPGGSPRALMLALLVSALLHPLLLTGIPFPRPQSSWGGQVLEVGFSEVEAPTETVAVRPARPAAPGFGQTPPPPKPAAPTPAPLPAPMAAHPSPRPAAAPVSAPEMPAVPKGTPSAATAQPSTNLAQRALNQARGWQSPVETTARVLHWRSGQAPQAYAVERYIEEWAQKVERIGNLNYPEAARRQRLSGTLRLSVTLDAEGQVLEVTVERSSGQPVLDQAAQHIVKLSGPFAAFPPALRLEADRLVISRVWNFSRSDHLASQ